MRFISIRQKASIIILVISVVAFFMVAIGWQSMRVSEATLSDFEAKTLPEISTSLTLAEGVAQLAATAPYTAGSGRPFQLQTESKRIHLRILALRGVANSLLDSSFRQSIDIRLDDLQKTLEELVSLVREELYIREDSYAQQFRIRHIAPQEGKSYSVYPRQGLDWLLQLLESPDNVPDSIFNKLALQSHHGEAADIAQYLLAAHHRLAQIQERKRYLLISIRAKSEALSAQVSQFVGRLQKKVTRQRESVSAFVSNGQHWIIGISIFLLLGLTRLYWQSQKMTRDLQAVTRDMEQLSLGRTDAHRLPIKRNDEIGTLAEAFEVFRCDAIRRLEVTAELSEQKHLLETIFDNMNDGLSVFSADGTLLAWNPGYEQLFSLEPNELSRGMPINEVQRRINKGEHTTLNIESKQIQMDEVNVARHVRSQSFERHFESGKIIEFRSKPMPEGGFVTLYTDLTERKSVESQLRQAQKMEMLGQLTGGVAHDFNNLLAAIMGNLQMLADSQPQTADQTRYIERALAVSEKSSNLVQRLLAFSRRQQLFPVSTHIDDLIEGMLDLVEYSVGAHINVSCDLQCADEVSLIDPSQLENALLNLALNSAAAMPDGGQLSFSTKRCTLPDSEVAAVRIKIEDSGEGISDAVLSRIFEPFFTTKPVGKGSGLGLSMIYGFVKQSGGEIKVTSEYGKWTRVCLFLPAQRQETQTVAATKKVPIAKISLPKESLLWLLEDDLAVQDTLREQCQKMGLLVQCFERAEDVLAALEMSFTPDVILSDVNLAGQMNGVELAHHIKHERKGEQVGSVPVVLMSGLPYEEVMQKYSLDETDIFLSKPFTINDLGGVLKVES
ncbi:MULTISPECIES: PAS-domain containing protein [Marinomonas]|uniref:PAS-domain containing protein n=1 Tax=Marinomonas TaxID=28253 RepID=UPI0010553829|nr:PAS-domain containing protein [Marinomonas sp. KMM3893]